MKPAEASALEGLAARVASGAAVVVFDLDDTLLSTARRHLRILREWALDSGALRRWPEPARKLAALPEAALRYSIADTARDCGARDPELLSDLKSFWSARFFRNDYLLADHPVPGAPEFCRRLEKAGASVVYMTGRDETMRAGTLATLERWGFPLPGRDRVRLLLKPRFDMADHEYKRDGLRVIGGLGEVAATFENEPAHLNLFAEAFPAAWHFLLETKHSGKPVEPHASARRLRDFRA